MFSIIIIGVLLLVAAAALVVSLRTKVPAVSAETDYRGRPKNAEQVAAARSLKGVARIAAIVAAAVALVVGVLSSTYLQDEGEAKITRSFTGVVTGQTTEPGLQFKAPWEKAITYDIRNNVVSYVADGAEDYQGGSAHGPQITVQDREGVTANLDVVVRYSIVPDAATEIYKQYGAQENFVQRVIQNSIRSVVREVPANYGTIEMFNQRGQVAADIFAALEAEWEGQGVIVEAVDLQEIRYPEAVTARFSEAQESRIAVDRAQAEQEAATVEAETRRIEAQGQADANRTLAESLTPEILQQRYVEALNSSDTVFVVPEGSQPLVNTGRE